MTQIKNLLPKQEGSTTKLQETNDFVKLSAQEYTYNSISNLITHMTKPSLSQRSSLLDMVIRFLDHEHAKYDADELYTAISDMNLNDYQEMRDLYTAKNWMRFQEKIKQLIWEV